MALVANAAPSPPRENLWDLAASQLSTKNKACINFSSITKLDDLLAAVDDRKRECQEKQWTVERGRERNAIVLRDVFTKIATWVEKFVACGDSAVQYDPGHAALPWAAVRFLLKVSVSDVQQYAIILEGLETASNLITRYEIMQRLYLEEETQAKDLLQSSIVTLYNKILIFLCKAYRHYSRSTAKRLVKNILVFQDKFQAILDEISQQDKKCQDLASLVEAEIASKTTEKRGVLLATDTVRYDDLRRELNEIQQPIDRMEQHLRDIQDGLNCTERLSILQWISPMPYKKHHQQTRKDILGGTGTWLLQEQQLLDWQVSSASSIMWLHGVPGSGKSKLVSILIDRFIDEFEADRNPNPIYFYCQRNSAEPERSNPEAILGSLVRQMSCLRPGGALLQPVLELYDARKKEGFAAGSLSSDECTALILEMTKDRLMTTIVIDALDECDPDKRDVLLEALSRIVTDSTGLVKLFISSRDDQDIVLHLGKGPNLKIQASHNQSDIARYVNNEVDKVIHSSKWRSSKVDEKLKQEIKLALTDKAQGMFRWVTMQLEFLCGLRLPASVKKRLGELPPNLLKIYDDNYSQKLKSYQEEERRIVKGAFRFLLCAREELNTRSFLKALSVLDPENESLSPDSLLELCFNFIDIDNESDVFRFAHLSVREYLESKSDYEPNSNHALAAECCVRLLSLDEVVRRYESIGHVVTKDVPGSKDSLFVLGRFERDADSELECLAIIEADEPIDKAFWDETALKLTDFHRYACIHWAFHLASSGGFRLISPLKDLSCAFMMDHKHATSKLYRVWSIDAYHRREDRVAEHRSEFIGALGINEWDIDEAHPTMDYLFAACVWGFDDLLEIRIRATRAARNPAKGPVIHDSGRALFFASKFGNYTAVRLLIEHGADLECKDSFGKTALYHSVVARSQQICRILLDNGADPDMGDWKSPSPLAYAVEERDLEITTMLLRYGANGGSKEKFHFGNDPLTIAVTNGDAEIAQVLLEHGAEPGIGDWKGESALTCAVKKRNLEITTMLLNYGAIMGVEYDDNDRCDPLSIAVTNRDVEIAEVLLEYGAYINEAGVLGIAIQTGQNDMAKLLLEHGANPNVYHNWYCSPVWFAALEGDMELLRMLFEWGARAPTKFWNDEGDPCFLWSLKKLLNADVVELLEAHACNFEDEVELEGEEGKEEEKEG